MESESANDTRRLYYKEELEGLVRTLRDIFNQKNRKAEQEWLLHEKDVLSAHPFLQEVFENINKDDTWNNVLACTPGKIEVTLLPALRIDRYHLLTSKDDMLMFPLSKADREFLKVSSSRMLTLFISLPWGCIRDPDSRDKKLLWGAEVPNKFFFGQDRETAEKGPPRYKLLSVDYPYR